jgi:HPt (histidine-containing phosphotransfer) domain-containing protein
MPHTIYRLSAQQVASQLDDETIVLNHQRGIYYSLNEVGTLVWEQLQQGPATIDQLKEAVMAAFEIDDQTCLEDLKTLLQSLEDEKLIEVVA